jgi:pyruvate-formate lyase-activating enzyme
MSDDNQCTMKIVQTQLPVEQPANFCVAPFISTMQTAHGKVTTCAYGAYDWLLEDSTPKEKWNISGLNNLRSHFANGGAPCTKCKNEENAGKYSLRLRLLDEFPTSYNDDILTGKWQNGPVHLCTKVSNICNLACRSCAGWDTNKYAAEGNHYLKTYQTQVLDLATNKLRQTNRYIPRVGPRHTDYSMFHEIDSNLRKIEFYGGETLLNLTHLEYLEELASKGLSRDITLMYATNCTQKLNPRHLKVWEKFKRIEFSLSIDHLGDKFHYLRWPGDWGQVSKNVDEILSLKEKFSNTEVFCMVSPCCTMYNAYYIDEVLDWGKEHVGAVYINMVADPAHIAINIAPEEVKLQMLDNIRSPEVRGFLQIKPHNPLLWKQFIIWAKRQDLYRNEDFTKTFPEFYEIIKPYWDSVTDLSEKNFYDNKELD